MNGRLKKNNNKAYFRTFEHSSRSKKLANINQELSPGEPFFIKINDAHSQLVKNKCMFVLYDSLKNLPVFPANYYNNSENFPKSRRSKKCRCCSVQALYKEICWSCWATNQHLTVVGGDEKNKMIMVLKHTYKNFPRDQVFCNKTNILCFESWLDPNQLVLISRILSFVP